MNIYIAAYLFAIATLLPSTILFAQNQSEIAFQIPEADLIPEGITYDPMEKAFYVSSTYKRKIVKINSKGIVTDFTTEKDELLGVLGLQVDPERRILWAVCATGADYMPIKDLTDEIDGSSGIFKYDLQTGTLIKKYTRGNLAKRSFLNDLTIDQQGKVFITDTMNGEILSIDPDKDSLYSYLEVPKGYHPNGIDISPDGHFLFVALYNPTPGGSILRMNINTRESELLELPENETIEADGLYYFQQSLIAVQPGIKDKIVARYYFDDNYTRIIKVESLVTDQQKELAQPTTGVVVDGDFYFIANSQLQIFRQIFNENKVLSENNLKDPLILKVRVI
ncbi:hypothetical protein BH23BAC1_BH23BAC1_12650 [soil metagenome]